MEKKATSENTFRKEFPEIVKGAVKERLGVYLDGLPLIKDKNKQRFLKEALKEVNNYDSVINCLQEYMNTFILNDSERCSILNLIGIVQQRKGEILKAKNTFSTAILIAKRIKEDEALGDVKKNIGRIYFEMGNLKKALKYEYEAVEIFRRINIPLSEANALVNLGIIYNEMSQFQKALDRFQEAYEICKRKDDLLGMANIIINIGCAYFSSREYKKALEHHKRALEIGMSIHNPQIEASALGNMGNVFREIKEYQKAIDKYQKADEIFKRINYPIGEVGNLINIGLTQLRLKIYKKALENFVQAKKKSTNLGIKKISQIAKKNINIVKLLMQKDDQFIKELAKTYGKNPERFIHLLKKNIGFEKISSDEEAKLFFYLGYSLCRLSYFNLAIPIWEKALKYHIKNKNKNEQLLCFRNLGDAYLMVKKYEKSIKYQKMEMEIIKEKGDKQSDLLACYGNLGTAYQKADEIGLAIENHNKALEIAKKINDRLKEAKCYTNLGNDFYKKEEYMKAIEYHNQALEFAKE